MEKEQTRTSLGIGKEGAREAEERMEDWYTEGTTSEVEEGEVVRGRVVHIGTSEVLVDVGYKSEGAIPIEEFRGMLPKVGDDIEVYLEAKEDSEGLIVLSKDKADKIKVWDAVTRAYEKGAAVEGRVVEVVKGGLAVDVGVKAFLPGSQVDLRPHQEPGLHGGPDHPRQGHQAQSPARQRGALAAHPPGGGARGKEEAHARGPRRGLDDDRGGEEHHRLWCLRRPRRH